MGRPLVGWTGDHRRLSGRLAIVGVGLAVVLAGCGGSGGSNSIGIGIENKSDEALASKSAPASSTNTSTSAAATARTPGSGPLSKEPHVKPASGPSPTKLVTKEIIRGTGAEAKTGSPVAVNYVGALYKTGKVFDASWRRTEPLTFTIGKRQVTPGLEQGVVGMKVGGRRELIVPAPLAYGAKGNPPSIPPNAPLVFMVDLLGV